jgi:hypothetical protein
VEPATATALLPEGVNTMVRMVMESCQFHANPHIEWLFQSFSASNLTVSSHQDIRMVIHAIELFPFVHLRLSYSLDRVLNLRNVVVS